MNLFIIILRRLLFILFILESMCAPATTLSAKENGVAVAPSKHAVPSGFARRKNDILFGMLLQIVVSGFAYWFQKTEAYFTPAEQYCADHDERAGGPCTRPDLFGFQCAAGMMLAYLGIKGFTAWHVTKNAHNKIPSTPVGRIFGFLPEGDDVNVAIFCWQVWDFICSSLIPELSHPLFLAHHALAGLTAYLSLEYQYVHHYAVFFGGCSEFSSIFLVLVDFAKFFPAKSGTNYGSVILGCQVSFALAFFCYRVVGWIWVSLNLWSDAREVLKDGKADILRPGKTFVLYMFLALDAVLGTLQVYWFYLIASKAVEMFS